MMNTLWNRARDRRNGDSGFTLVELLVVIVIIGILVAIAIPVFLSQREKGWASASQSDLRNTAPIAESIFADTGSYATVTPTTLLAGGMNETDSVTISVISANDADYCLKAVHGKLTAPKGVYYLDSTTGGVSALACT